MPSLATNSETNLTVTVRRRADNALVDPDTIELVYWLGRYGDRATVPQSGLTRNSMGVYSANIIPSEENAWFGIGMRGRPAYLNYEFRMTNPTYVERGKVSTSTSEACP